MNGKNPVSPKRVVASNIPNDNPQFHRDLTFLSKAVSALERGNSSLALAQLNRVQTGRLPLASRAEAFETSAVANQNLGRFLDAKVACEKSHRIYQQINDRHSTLQTALRCADILRQLERFVPALNYYRKAHRLISKNRQFKKHYPSQLIDAQTGEALCLRGLGQLKSAARLLSKCLSGYKRMGDKNGEAYINWALGTTYRFMGEFRRAKFHLTQSIQLYRRLSDPNGLAYALCGLGGTLRMVGDAATSGRLYEKAYRTFQKESDEFGMAYSMCGQGNAWRMQNQPRRGLPFMNRAIALYRRLGQRGPQAFVLWSRSQSWRLLEKYDRSKSDLKKAERLFESVSDRRGVLYCELGFAELARSLNDKKSIRIYRRAASRAIKLGLPFEKLHAFSRLGENVTSQYKNRGVDITKFRHYRSFP